MSPLYAGVCAESDSIWMVQLTHWVLAPVREAANIAN